MKSQKFISSKLLKLFYLIGHHIVYAIKPLQNAISYKHQFLYECQINAPYVIQMKHLTGQGWCQDLLNVDKAITLGMIFALRLLSD